jgi:hypothetical protein
MIGRDMSFDIQNIPSVIQGTASQPGLYGKTAHQQNLGYFKAVQDDFIRTKNFEPLEKLNNASIRYSPEGTMARGAITEEGIQNAFGYAAADIQEYDEDGDQALSKQEVLKAFISPAQSQLDQLEGVLLNPDATQEEREEANSYRSLIINVTGLKAANYIKSVDTPDAEGQRDEKIAVDEAAAKLLFDDTAKQMFTDNQQAYKTIIDGLQNKTQYDGPSFEQLEHAVNQVVDNNPDPPYEMDGQLTSGERDIADILTAAPIPTNQIVSQIHQTLDLKTRAEQYTPFNLAE